EMAKKTLRSDFVSIDPASSHIVVIEGGERLLDSFDPKLSSYAADALRQMGVEVRLGNLVGEISKEGVRIDEELVPAATVIWAAGVAPSPIGRRLGVACDRAGRILVEPDLSLSDHPEIFAIGDLSAAKDENGRQLPGVAPVAVQQGKHVAHVIGLELQRKESAGRPAFRYFDKGQMATIGRRRAVLQIGKLRLTGTTAWFGWLFVHILFLNGMRNRVFVFLSWVWSYLLYSRGARLIVPSRWKSRDAGFSSGRQVA
ncbi:MAG: FAD-dependent oxidoreductase, partial [Planctomycetota bacterium]